jgi:hypothetical protein
MANPVGSSQFIPLYTTDVNQTTGVPEYTENSITVSQGKANTILLATPRELDATSEELKRIATFGGSVGKGINFDFVDRGYRYSGYMEPAEKKDQYRLDLSGIKLNDGSGSFQSVPAENSSTIVTLKNGKLQAVPNTPTLSNKSKSRVMNEPPAIHQNDPGAGAIRALKADIQRANEAILKRL